MFLRPRKEGGHQQGQFVAGDREDHLGWPRSPSRDCFDGAHLDPVLTAILLVVWVEVRRRHDEEAVLLLRADKRLQFAVKPWLGHGIEPGLPGEIRDAPGAPDVSPIAPGIEP
jgi:hypothetical protein